MSTETLSPGMLELHRASLEILAKDRGSNGDANVEESIMGAVATIASLERRNAELTARVAELERRHEEVKRQRDRLAASRDGWRNKCGFIDRCLRKRTDELTEARKDGQWQPIETCPENVAVLLYLPGWEHYGPAVYRGILVNMGTGRRWLTTAWSSGRDYPETPGGWMPLPSPKETL